MDRIDGANFVADLFGAGKSGFRDGVLEEAIFPTYLNAKWFNGVQEELMNVIEGAGIPPDAAVRNQVYKAIKRLAGGNVTTVNAANSPLALSADNAGLIIMDATTGNISATLPAANALAGLTFKFVRVDAATNVATVNRAGADTIEGATSFTLAPSYDHRTIATAGAAVWLTVAAKPSAVGQCYLDKSALNLVLSRQNGRMLSIAGWPQNIPAAGVSLAPTGLLAATLYYIYAYMVAGVMTLEASTTGHSIDPVTGMRTKTGDVSRTLVGAWRTAGAAVWSTNELEGASYFNRRKKARMQRLSAPVGSTSGTWVEISTDLRVSFFIWGDELPLAIAAGAARNTTSGGNAFTAINFDSILFQSYGVRAQTTATSTFFPFSVRAYQPDSGRLAEGIHYATMIGAGDPGTNATWDAWTDYGCHITVETQG